jgi:hypothetical protein
MIVSEMFYSIPPSFEEIIKRIEELEATINTLDFTKTI